jgi:hypothetical protein
MKKNKTVLAIAGLLVICAVLAAGLFTLGQPPQGEDAVLASGDTLKDVKPSDITAPAETTGSADASGNPITVPDAAQTPTPVIDVPPITVSPQGSDSDEQTGGDIPLTIIEDKPEPPEPPADAHQDEDTEQHERPTDPELTNPDVKPDSTPIPAEPTPPQETSPQSGDHNGSGEVYIPGFGWVKDEGGGSHGEQSHLDPEHDDFDNIIGY